MIDLSEGAKPNSQQLNADDLIAGPITIKITGVRDTGADQQRYWVSFEGDNGKPWKPCKSMLRVMIHMWGKDGQAYTGRSLTLFCDPTVTFGPDTTGGIRISHMSHIDKDTTIPLTVKRGKKKPYQVRKLTAAEPAPEKPQSPKGNIEQAKTALEGAFADDVETLLAPLREFDWTPEEKKTLAQLKAAALKRKRP